jgi:curli biogenesis system outer membrane secretion channel CsgG
MKKLITVFTVVLAFCLVGCYSMESSRSLRPDQPETARRTYNGPRSSIAVGQFTNNSAYMNGIFSNGTDQLGGQAKTILITHLNQTNRFNVLDRDNMEQASREAEIRGESQNLMGAAYILTGSVTEFGRKEEGNMALFGILGSGKRQLAYAVVSINVVDIRTTAVVYSVQGAGEYELTNSQFLGFATYSGYDSTLNGKVLDLAIREAVDRLAEAIDRGYWKPAGN